MNRISYRRAILSAITLLCLFDANSFGTTAAAAEYQIGVGSSDITGPVVGVQFWGFVREGQNGEGLHLRQRARAFVVADAKERLAIVVCDLGSITPEMNQEVLERLQKEFGDSYTRANLLLTATHTHAAPGGFWHTGVGTPFGSALHQQYFGLIVEGIVSSIRQAHQTLQPGRILVAQGEVPDAGRNRSLVAYMNNPAEERERYASNTDTTMTMLRFQTANGPIGCVNWFAVHPTTMTYNNKLVSSDNKGYAEVQFERAQGVTYRKAGEFVAAFAQANCGDVTGNLNLNNTGPGENEFETTRIIGERQNVIAQELFDSASDELSGPVGSRQSFVDVGNVHVAEQFTGAGSQSTAPAAYGYSFAAGSTEDGGGHPLFKEGMKEKTALVEMTLDQQFPDARPSDDLRARHQPKPILIAPGGMETKPGIGRPASLTVARIGNLAIVAGPSEFTTMSGRRIRESVKAVLGDDILDVVIAGYTNGYAGYVTTREEYETQHYEGGHTLFGPWTLAAFQQEYVRIAGGLAAGDDVATVDTAAFDKRGKVPSTNLGTGADVPPAGGKIGEQTEAPPKSARPGETVTATFHTSNPVNHYPHVTDFVSVEQQTDAGWIVVADDADWSTKCVFTPKTSVEKPYEVVASWEIPTDTSAGTYRIVHRGRFRASANADATDFTGVSDPVKVTE